MFVARCFPFFRCSCLAFGLLSLSFVSSTLHMYLAIPFDGFCASLTLGCCFVVFVFFSPIIAFQFAAPIFDSACCFVVLLWFVRPRVTFCLGGEHEQGHGRRAAQTDVCSRYVYVFVFRAAFNYGLRCAFCFGRDLRRNFSCAFDVSGELFANMSRSRPCAFCGFLLLHKYTLAHSAFWRNT